MCRCPARPVCPTGLLALAGLCACFGAPARADDIRQLIVNEIRLSNPQSPMEYLEAVRDLLNVGEAELAKSYAEQLLGMSISEEQRAQLYRKLGSAFFVRLQQAPGMGAAGQQLSERFVTAAQRIATDPQRLEALVEQARDADPAVRTAARGQLRETGAPAVSPILAALVAEQRDVERGWIRDALAAIGPAGVPALTGVLASGNARLEFWALTGLSDQSPAVVQPAVPFMVRAAFDPQADAGSRDLAREVLRRAAGVASEPAAMTLLQREIEQRLNSRSTAEEWGDMPREYWIWDAAAGRLESRLLMSHAAAWLQASWLADDLLRLAPAEVPHQLDLLVTHLGWAKQLYGWDQPLPTEFAKTWLSQLPSYSQLLGLALETSVQRGWDDAAQGAAELLGQLSADEFSAAVRSNLTALAGALRAPAARVRWAAVETLLTMAPEHAFAGTSDLLDELCRAAAAQGVRRALLAQPASQQAADLVNWLGSMGFAARQLAGGRELFRVLRTDPDVELILVSDALSRPEALEIVQQLAANYHAAQMPLALLSQGANLLRSEELLARLRYGIAAVPPQDPEALGIVVSRALAQGGPVPSSPNMRLARAARALQWIGFLADHRRQWPHYDLARCEAAVSGALQHPGLAPEAVSTLAAMATPQAQVSLTEFASQAWHPFELRLEAVEALRSAVDKAGLLLTQEQVARQYERYNRGLGGNPESSEVLSRLLDMLESRPPSP